MTSVNPFKARDILQCVPFIVSTSTQLYSTERLHLLAYPVTSTVLRKTIKDTPCIRVTCFQVKKIYFVFRQYLRSVLLSHFLHLPRPALRPTQPPVQWVPGLSRGGKVLPGRDADPSPPSSAEVKNRIELYLYSP